MARKKKHSLILKLPDGYYMKSQDSFGDYEYGFYQDVVEALDKKGLQLSDIIGKKIGISFKVGCKRKLKSYRFQSFRSYVRCECCGPMTLIH